MEAWLVCLYIHFGGYPTVERIGQDALHNLVAVHEDAARFDRELTATQKEARNRRKAVESANAGMRSWNAANPDKPAKKLHEVPYIPQLTPLGVDFSSHIASFGALTPQCVVANRISFEVCGSG
jgi:hypothetical protein